MIKTNTKTLLSDHLNPFIKGIDLSGFIKTRKAHRFELIEDYVELILDLISEYGQVRQVDLALRLGVTQPTVAKMLKKLTAFSLIKQKKSYGILLTEEGKELANKNRIRHNIVKNFLINLGVSEKIAQQDSEGIEHHVSDETLLIFKQFSKKK